MESLESLCLDRVVAIIPSLKTEIDGLPLVLLKTLMSRCSDYHLAIIHDIAVTKGLDIQAVWQSLCGEKFSWFYRHKFQSNLHDPVWLCTMCQLMTSSDPGSRLLDWHQTYLDKKCEGHLEELRTRYSQRAASGECILEEMKQVLRNPFHRASEDMFDYYPQQLLLDIKTVIALSASPQAISLLANNLHTLMCRVQIPTKYKHLASTALEKLLRTLREGGKLETFYLKEQQVMGGETMNYSKLFAILLEGATHSHSPTQTGAMAVDVDRCGLDENREDTLTMHGLDTNDSIEQCQPHTRWIETQVGEDESHEDLYDFCFKEPVKAEIWNFLEEDECRVREEERSIQVAAMDAGLFCEEGVMNETNHDLSASDSHMDTSLGRTWNPCPHSEHQDYTYFHQILRPPAPGPKPGHSISNLVLVYVKLSPESCTVLADGLAHSRTLKSLALIQCVMPSCGWCQLLSGLAVGAKHGLMLDELALTCRGAYGVPPKSFFGQYCVHKLNDMLETYHRRNHIMSSLKLELLLSSDCQAAESSYLPKFLSSIGCFSLTCWGLSYPHDNPNPHPLHQLVLLEGLVETLPTRGSVLTDLLLENLSLDTKEVDAILAAAAGNVQMKRVSVKNNKYSTPQPAGLVALLRHSGLRSLNICKCKFSLKVCDKQFQDAIVDALVDNSMLEHLNLSDGILDDSDLSVLVHGFTRTQRTSQQPGYCLNICLSRFSRKCLADFGAALQKDTASWQGNQRLHSLDHLSLDWRCVDMVKTLQNIIPRVSCPHRLS